MTPDQMQEAGELLNMAEWSDAELALAIAGLSYVLPFLEGAGYSIHITGPLEQSQLRFMNMEIQRSKDRGKK